MSRDGIARHWADHVSTVRKSELIGGPVALDRLVQRAATESRSAFDYLVHLRSELFKLFDQCKERGYFSDASSVASRLTRVIELGAQMSGELRRGAGITINNQVNAANINTGSQNILGDPDAIRLQACILKALARFPEARTAVVLALRKLDGQPIPNGHIDEPKLIEGTTNA